MDRRFFVLTHTGEQGPFTAEDLRREVLAGTIAPGDTLRTAMGKASGTVGELLGPQARVSGRMAAHAPSAGGAAGGRRSEPRLTAPAPRRSPSDGRLQAEHRGGARNRSLVLPIIAIGLVAVTGVLAAVLATRAKQGAEPAVQSEALPTITIQAPADAEIRWNDPKSCPFEVRSSVPVAQDVVVRLQWSGTGLSGVASQPGSVIIPSGRDRAVIEITPTTVTPATWERREVVVTLQPDAMYRLGSKIFDRLAVQGASANPSLAYEPFAYDSDYQLTSTMGGSGWAGPWSGSNVSMEDGTIVIPRLARDFGRSVRIGTMINRSPLIRRLKTRIDTGELWVSFRAQLMREEGYHDQCWGGIGLCDGDQLRLFCGKPAAFPHWGLELHADPMESWRKADDQDLFEPVFLVTQVVFAQGRSSYRLWRNPPAGPQAPAAPTVAVLDAPGFGVDGVELLAGDNCSVRLDELRLGRTFAEVVPAFR